MNAMIIAQTLLPAELSQRIADFPEAEEIRLRVGQPPGIILSGTEVKLDADPVTKETLLQILEKATGASLHAAALFIRSGYVTYRGIRIGLCGEAVYHDGELAGLRHFSSLALRLPRDSPEELQTFIEQLPKPGTADILIAAPPGVGKTTCLREIIRQAAQSCRVGVVDERGELSGTGFGVPQFDLGPCSDVLAGIEKGKAAMMLLRGMNAQIIAMDEITQESDVETVRELFGCGVRIFASAHGENLEKMRKRRLYRELVDAGIFDILITIRLSCGRRVYTAERLRL